ncbi:MAG: AarF/UbiB family protein [Allorhizobium sp.]
MARQVFRGQLRDEWRSVSAAEGGAFPAEVAVKVRRPGMRWRFQRDVRLLRRGARLVTWLAPRTQWLALEEVRAAAAVLPLLCCR